MKYLQYNVIYWEKDDGIWRRSCAHFFNIDDAVFWVNIILASEKARLVSIETVY